MRMNTFEVEKRNLSDIQNESIYNESQRLKLFGCEKKLNNYQSLWDCCFSAKLYF